MQDSFDTPPPSVVKPILYGAVLGLTMMAIVVVAYVVAPNFTLAGTLLIAACIAVLVAIVLNAVPSRAGGDVAALVRGEDLPAVGVPSSIRPAPPSPEEIRLTEREARVAELRRQTDAIDRGAQGQTWLESARALADEIKALATDEMSLPGRKRQQAGLGHFRQAANIYRRVTTARGASRSSREWAVANIALGECLLVLGEAEGARDEVMEAVNALTTGLTVADLSQEERSAGDNALAQAEGVLASMAEASRSPMDEGFI